MIDKFKSLGFTAHVVNAQTHLPSVLSNSDMTGVLVRLNHEDNTFQIFGGEVKFFGEIQYPYMSGDLEVKEIERMINTMKHYVNICELYPAW